jgi:squalene/oxidosqualene cyclase-like protein
LASTQSSSGSWHADYGSVPVFLSLQVITCQVIGAMPDEAVRAGMERYYRNRQNPDGGWGIDVESESIVLSSVLAYTAMRLLGVPAQDECLRQAREWFLPYGGALAMPHWGKIFLAVLGAFEWRGLYPFTPEIWLLPRALPIHPGRLWSYPRQVFMSMSYLYGGRCAQHSDALVDALREELYATPYREIDWASSRTTLAPTDAFRPRSRLLRVVFAALSGYEWRPSLKLRERAMAEVLGHIEHENRSSNFVGNGPIPKVLDTLVWHFARPGGEEITAHARRLDDYLWEGPDGVRVQSYNSSEAWDTAFAVQALATAQHPDALEALRSASGFVALSQRLTEVPDAARHFRNPGLGGWPLSTGEQGWVISDGTAETLKAVLALQGVGLAGEITPERLALAVDVLLSMQNDDGGWATYDRNTAPKWMERLNFSDVFHELMTDRSTTEPTSSCISALHQYGCKYGTSAEVTRAIVRGEDYLLRAQRHDGSWEGFWGVCFTYGTWFGIRGLKESADPRAAAAIDRACAFLLTHQRPDGGWGETIDSCRHRQYVHAERGQATMTAWALLALADAGRGAAPAARRAAAFLVRAQDTQGDWHDNHLCGAFNRSSAMNYDAFRRIFPLWALSAVAEEQS